MFLHKTSVSEEGHGVFNVVHLFTRQNDSNSTSVSTVRTSVCPYPCFSPPWPSPPPFKRISVLCRVGVSVYQWASWDDGKVHSLSSSNHFCCLKFIRNIIYTSSTLQLKIRKLELGDDHFTPSKTSDLYIQSVESNSNTFLVRWLWLKEGNPNDILQQTNPVYHSSVETRGITRSNRGCVPYVVSLALS